MKISSKNHSFDQEDLVFTPLPLSPGAITGIASIWTLSFISYDRYNVIVKGVSGTPLTSGRATAFVLFAWIYAIAWSLPPFFGWGKYIPEGE